MALLYRTTFANKRAHLADGVVEAAAGIRLKPGSNTFVEQRGRSARRGFRPTIAGLNRSTFSELRIRLSHHHVG
jgi:hypothetical protein